MLLSKFRDKKTIETIYCVLFTTLVFSTASFSTFVSSNSVINLIPIICTAVFLLFISILVLINKRIRVSPLYFTPLIFLAVVLISTLFNKTSIVKTTPLILLMIIGFVILTKSLGIDNKKIIYSYYFGIFVFSLFFLLLIAFGLNKSSGEGRYGSIFGDENEVALYFASTIFLALYFLFFNKHSSKLASILAIPSFICGLLTGSKGFVISVLFSIYIIMAFYNGRKHWIRTLLIIIISIGLFIILSISNIPFISTYLQRIISSVFNVFSESSSDYSTQNRLSMFFDAWNLFLHKPILGHGNRAYYYYSSFGGGGWSHNQFTEILCSYGILGFISFGLLFIIPFLQRKDKTDNIPIMLVFFMISWMFSVSFDTLKIFMFLYTIILLCLPTKIFTLDLSTKYKITICAYFGDETKIGCDGATTKARNVFDILKNKFDNSINKVSLPSWKRSPITNLLKVMCAYHQSDYLVILPNDKRLKIFFILNRLFNRKNKIKIIYMVVGGWLPDFLENNPKYIPEAKKIYKIFPETHGMVNRLEKLGCDNAVRSPVFTNRKRIPDEYLINNDFFTDQIIRICCFSRVSIAKGIVIAADAVRKANMKLIKKYKLYIYGKVQNSEQEYFNNFFKEYSDVVVYEGIIKDDDVIKTINKHFLMLFPTYFDGEGFPATLLESYISSVPVIASDWKYNSEIVNEGITGFLFENKNTEQLSEILVRCANEYEGVLSMRANCFAESKKYDPDEAMKQVILSINS